jgi:hypothetical protein
MKSKKHSNFKQKINNGSHNRNRSIYTKSYRDAHFIAATKMNFHQLPKAKIQKQRNSKRRGKKHKNYQNGKNGYAFKRISDIEKARDNMEQRYIQEIKEFKYESLQRISDIQIAQDNMKENLMQEIGQLKYENQILKMNEIKIMNKLKTYQRFEDIQENFSKWEDHEQKLVEKLQNTTEICDHMHNDLNEVAAKIQKHECSICLENAATYAYFPCGHLCICGDCCNMVPDFCVICCKDAQILQIIRP